MSTISVIIATYGEDEWLFIAKERAIPSVEGQGCDYIIERHERRGTRASSLNNAVSAAVDTDWLIFLDADDELAPGYVAAMRDMMWKRPGNNVLFTPAVQWVRRGRPSPPAFQAEVPLERGNWLVIGTMISRQLFTEIGGFHEHPHGLEDWNLWARAVRAGATIVKVPDAVYIAHWNAQSKHHKLFRDRRNFAAAYEAARVDAWG